MTIGILHSKMTAEKMFTAFEHDCIIIELIVSCHANCVIESLVEKRFSESVNDCCFVTTNVILTKMKIHLQPMNVK